MKQAEVYNPCSEDLDLHDNFGNHSERSAASLRNDGSDHRTTAPSPPAALSQGQGIASQDEGSYLHDAGSRPSAQRSCNTGSGSLATSTPSLEAAQITLRSRRLAPLARVSQARRIRREERGGQVFLIFPDGTTAPDDEDYNPFHGSFVIAAQKAMGLIKGGKTLPADAVTILLTRIVVHMGERERSCRLYRLPVVLALIGCPDASGNATDTAALARRANKTERALATAIRSLVLDGGDTKTAARRSAGVEVREIRTTKGGK